MYKVEVTLPTTQHNGDSNTHVINHIEDEIARDFGGYTATTAWGAWYDEDGTKYYDNSVLVWTLVESQEQVNDVLSRAPGWAVRLQQISLTVTVSTLDVHFIAGTREQAITQEHAA